MQDMPGAPGMKMYSREEIQKNPSLMNDGGGAQDPDADDEDWEDDEDDVATSQVLHFHVHLIKIIGLGFRAYSACSRT